MIGENQGRAVWLAYLMSTTLCSWLGAQEQVVENFANGKPQRIYTVDAEGRRHGRFESYFPSGGKKVTAAYHKDRIHGLWRELDRSGKKVVIKTYRLGVLSGNFQSFYPGGAKKVVTAYRDGKLEGRFKQFSADQNWQREARYKAGKLHGKVTIKSGRKVVSRQRWVEGELTGLDGMAPYSRGEAELRLRLSTILHEEPRDKGVDKERAGSDPLAKQRAAALRRLQAYRYLCGLRYEDIELVPKWNDLCDAASEVGRANGKISHTPDKPSGFDDARFAKGYLGANRSNLIGGGSMVSSVDAYMDDSDPSNIDRVGHRRWCLNPAMMRTGFGGAGRYSAMWAMDSSGAVDRQLQSVSYPPAGRVPVDLFGPNYAWSLAILRGHAPKSLEAVKITIHRLDEFYQEEGEALALNHLGLAAKGQGTSTCIVFRPLGIVVEPGVRYLIRVSFDAGKTEAYRYLVEFCAAVSG